MDASHFGFQCVNGKNQESFLPIEKGMSQECIPLDETEVFLKKCKEGVVVPTTICKYRPQAANKGEFACIDPQGTMFVRSIYDLDNSFCTTQRDRNRIIDRCKNQ